MRTQQETKKYVSFARRLEARIISGELKANEPVPPVRQLLSAGEFSIGTVTKGLELLEGKGLITRMPNRGHLVTDRGLSAEPKVAHIAYVTPALSAEAAQHAEGIEAAIHDFDNLALATFAANANLAAYQRLIQQALGTKPAGLILSSANVPGFDETIFKKMTIPAVLLKEHFASLVCDRVCYDYRLAAKKIARYLRNKGYQSAAVIQAHLPNDTTWDLFREAMAAALHSERVQVRPEDFFSVHSPHGYGQRPDPYADTERAVAKILAAGHKFRVLVCGHDYPAVAAMRAIRAAGLRIPQDIAVISASGMPVDLTGLPTLTTIHYSNHIIGHMAVEMLLRRMEDSNRPVEIHYISGDLVPGESA